MTLELVEVMVKVRSYVTYMGKDYHAGQHFLCKKEMALRLCGKLNGEASRVACCTWVGLWNRPVDEFQERTSEVRVDLGPQVNGKGQRVN